MKPEAVPGAGVPKKPEPLLKSYRVCLVVPQIGLNAAQIAEVEYRVRRVAPLLPEGERVHIVVPTYDPDRPEHGVQDEVRNLARLGARVELVGFDPRRGLAAFYVVQYAEFTAPCDEVWCCPESPNRKARANQVYRLGVRGKWPTRYKTIPPWVEPQGVAKPAAKQMKKERPW